MYNKSFPGYLWREVFRTTCRTLSSEIHNKGPAYGRWFCTKHLILHLSASSSVKWMCGHLRSHSGSEKCQDARWNVAVLTYGTGDGIVQSDCSSKLGKGRKRAWLCSALQGWRQAAGAPFPNTLSLCSAHRNSRAVFLQTWGIMFISPDYREETDVSNRLHNLSQLVTGGSRTWTQMLLTRKPKKVSGPPTPDYWFPKLKG